MSTVLDKIQKIGLVPVVKIDREEDALPLAEALIDGGLPCAEITFRTAAAKGAIAAITAKYPEMLVGAGTVLTKQQVDDSIEAGATFIVSPGLNPEIVQYCIDKGIPVTPGCSCPSDVEKALALGLDTVKFFPAETAGGLAMIKAMAAPYVNVKFMPTGGINEKNLTSYLDFKKIIACGGSWMVPGDMIQNGEFDKIKTLTREAVQKMLGFELAQVGLTSGDQEKALRDAKLFAALMGLSVKAEGDSVQVGDTLEIGQLPAAANGYIGIRTNYLDRAVAYLERNGFTTAADTAVYGKGGELSVIYLNEEVAGFAIRLIQK